jgi:peptidoglycan/LPS O-acetylase OafA/YrhL
MGTALAFDGRADEGPDPRVTGLRMAGPLAVALALLLGRWLVAPWIPDTRVANVAARMLSAAGATLLVDLVRRAPAMAGTLGRTPVQWLGSRSFSVYLVHEPIVVASAFAWRTVPNPAWFVPWIVLVSLAVGEIFYRIVERPALTLAARVGH